MWVHLGTDTAVRTSDIIGVFDLDNTTVSKHTRGYLREAQEEKRVVNVSNELPKSFVVCREKSREMLYISPISVQTLQKRMNENNVESA